MSDADDNDWGIEPFEFAETEPARPPIAVPVPVPAPAATLDYASPRARPQRPGRLLALGIISLLLGLVAVFANGSTAAVWYREARRWQPAAPPPPPPTPLPEPDVQPFDPDYTGPRGMRAAERAPLVVQAQRLTTISGDRAIMLDRLLAEVGKDVLPAAGETFREPQEAPASAMTVLEQPIGRTMEGPLFRVRDEPPGVRLLSSGGCVDLTNNSARFIPNHGDPVAVRLDVWIPKPGEFHCNATATTLNVEAARRQVGGRMTALQGGVLRDWLRAIHGSPSEKPLGEVRLVGDAIETSAWPQQRIYPTGLVVDLSQYRHSVDPVTRIPNPNPNVRPPLPRQSLPGSPTAMRLVGTVAGAGVLLGVFLMLCGTGLLWQRPGAVASHQRFLTCWVVLQLASVASGVIWVEGWRAQAASDPAMAAGGFTPGSAYGHMLLALILQSIYPLILFFALGSEAVVDYCRLRGEPVAPARWEDLRQRWARALAGTAGRSLLYGLCAVGALAVLAQLAMVAVQGSDAQDVADRVVCCILGAAIALGAAVVLWKQRSRPSSATLAGVLAALLLCSANGTIATAAAPTAMGFKPPGQAQPPDEATIQRELARLTKKASEPNTLLGSQDMYDLLRLGSAGQPLIFRTLADSENPRTATLLSALSIRWSVETISIPEANVPAAIAAAPAILQGMNQLNCGVRIIRAIGPRKEIYDVLTALTLRGEEKDRQWAAESMDKVNSDPAAKAAAYRRVLPQHGYSYERGCVLLAQLGEPGQAVLLEITKAKEETRRGAAVAALTSSKLAEVPEVKGRLVEMLDDRHDSVAQVAADYLVRNAEGRRIVARHFLASGSSVCRTAMGKRVPYASEIMRAPHYLPDSGALMLRLLEKVDTAPPPPYPMETILEELDGPDPQMKWFVAQVVAEGHWRPQLGPHRLRQLGELGAANRVPGGGLGDSPGAEGRASEPWVLPSMPATPATPSPHPASEGCPFVERAARSLMITLLVGVGLTLIVLVHRAVTPAPERDRVARRPPSTSRARIA